jgi:hypothetical protein
MVFVISNNALTVLMDKLKLTKVDILWFYSYLVIYAVYTAKAY